MVVSSELIPNLSLLLNTLIVECYPLTWSALDSQHKMMFCFMLTLLKRTPSEWLYLPMHKESCWRKFMVVSFLVTLLLRVCTISRQGGIGGMGMCIVTAVLASLVLLTMVLVVGTELHCNPFLFLDHSKGSEFTS